MTERKIVPLTDDEFNTLIFEGVFPSSFGKLIQPAKLASGSEHGEQVAFFAWAARAADYVPALVWAYATPNGGSRGDSERSRAIEGGKMKAEGVKPGVPDVFLPIPRKHVGLNSLFAGAYCELKTKDGGDGGSDNQHKWIKHLQSVGYAVTMANGWHEMRRFFVSYLEIERK